MAFDGNSARFLVDGLPSEDVNGNRGVVVANSATVTVQLEVIPSGALSATFQLFDINDPNSPLASLNAPVVNFNGSGTPLELLTDPDNETATFDMPASGIEAYLVRCTVATASGPQVFERAVVTRGINSGLRKTFPAESQEFEARGWSDELNRMVDAIEGLAAGGGGNLQTAYNFGAFGGTVTVAVDGTNDLFFDESPSQVLGAGLFALRRNLGGGEATVLIAPNTLDDDNSIEGTAIAIVAGGGSNQVTADTGEDGGDGGTVTIGIIVPGGSGSPSAGTNGGGGGGGGGNINMLTSPGGAGGDGSGVFAPGTGGDSGDIDIAVAPGGVGGAGTASTPGGVGGDGGSIDIGQSGVKAGDGGPSTDASQAAGAGGAGGQGINIVAIDGGNAGAAAGGAGADGGIGADIFVTAGSGGLSTGSGTDGLGGNLHFNAGAGDTDGFIEIGVSNTSAVISGVGNASPITRWTHGGDFAVDNNEPKIILVNQSFGDEDAKRWIIQAEAPDDPNRFIIAAGSASENSSGLVLTADRVDFSSTDVNLTTLYGNQILLAVTNAGGLDFSTVLIRPSGPSPTGDLAKLLTLESQGGSNQATIAMYSGDRNPEGNVIADSGDVYFSDQGASSAVYVFRGTNGTNTGWVEVGEGATTLQDAYEGSNTILTVIADGSVAISNGDAVIPLTLQTSFNVAAMDVQVDAAAGAAAHGIHITHDNTVDTANAIDISMDAAAQGSGVHVDMDATSGNNTEGLRIDMDAAALGEGIRITHGASSGAGTLMSLENSTAQMVDIGADGNITLSANNDGNVLSLAEGLGSTALITTGTGPAILQTVGGGTIALLAIDPASSIVLQAGGAVGEAGLLASTPYQLLSAGYTADAPRTGGIMVNHDPSLTTDTVSGAYVAGVAATSNPTVATVGAATFSVDDIVIINLGISFNPGVFEVLSHAANLLTIRGVGLTDTVEDFAQRNFVSKISDGATITKCSVSVIRTDTSGDWEAGKGDATPIVYTPLLGGTVSLQDAYAVGNAIAVTTVNGSVALSNTTDLTDTLTVTRGTFVGAGHGIRVNMGLAGENLTDDGIQVNVGSGTGGGRGIFVSYDGTGEALLVHVQGGTPIMNIDGAGFVDFTPETDRDFSVTTIGTGSIELAAAGNGTALLATAGTGDVTVAALVSGDVILTAVAGAVVANAYTFPTLLVDTFSFPDTDGSANQSLLTDGAGNLSFGNRTLSFATTGVSDNTAALGFADVYVATANNITITISTADITDGREFTFKDESGAASAASPVTIATQGAQTIDGDVSLEIRVAFGAVTMYARGGNLFSTGTT